MQECFHTLVEAARGVDLADPAAAEAELTRRLDPAGEAAAAVVRELVALLEEGRIAHRGASPVRWSRVCKAGEESLGFSIDAVLMDGPGPRHSHPRGEIDFCIPLEGDPRFDGRDPGWVVLGEGSSHVPTVAGGRMLIVYLLPDGEIEFES